jgi:hypothetical protein
MFIHGGGVTSIAAPAFPYAHPRLGLLVTLVYEGPEDDDAPHQLRVAIEDDQGQEITRLVELESSPPPQRFETRDTKALLHLLGDAAGLSFPEPGRYWVVLSLNDDELDRIVLDVAAEWQPPAVNEDD